MTRLKPSAPDLTAPPAGKAARTRDSIVDAAIRLFKERGISAVTTNHIAAGLGISPGNLYYHFRNKEEIVRAAYDLYGREADALLEPAGDEHAEAAALLGSYVTATMRLILRWPFFFEDMAELCRRDADLAGDLKVMQRRWVAHLSDVLARLRAAGLVADDVRDEDLRLLAGNVWMVARSILEFTRNEVDGEIGNEAAVRRGVRHIFGLVRPHLTPGARTALDMMLTDGDDAR